MATTIWATTAVTPRSATASANTAKPGAAAATPRPTAARSSIDRDQAAAFEQIPERNEQRQPDDVAGLADRYQAARPSCSDTENA